MMTREQLKMMRHFIVETICF